MRKKIRKRRYYYNGKRVSKGERKIAAILDKFNIPFKMEQTFKGLVGDKGTPLRFDFFLYDRDTCIEYQGPHHFKPVNKYPKAKRIHEKTVKYDKRKKEYMEPYSTTIFEISYKDFDNIELILVDLLGLVI